MRFARGLGAPALLAIGASAIGSFLYFGLGVVAGRALGLTPAVLVLAALFFLVTTMTYAEGASLYPERGGASTFARYAFDELWSFVAGWAILLDYLIVMALAVFSVSHYLAAFWAGAGETGFELVIALAAVAFVVVSNVRGLSADRLDSVLLVSLLNLGLIAVVVVVGLGLLYEPGEVLGAVELGRSPSWGDLVFGAVVATAAITGIEAASGLAGEIQAGRRELRRLIAITGVGVLAIFAGVGFLALAAAPVRDGATALGGQYLEAPLLGIVSAFQPAWLREAFRYAVGLGAAVLLVQAANGNMLGLSRLAYSLATNRQIPTSLGRLYQRFATPHLVISLAAVGTLALVASLDVEFLAGIFAFGAMLATTIAHVSVIRLRFRPERERAVAFRVPFNVRVRGASVPIPALVGAVLSFSAWLSVLALHQGARIVGGLWMVTGVTLYVMGRRRDGLSLTQRVTVAPQTLQETPEVEYGSILVPVFGGPLDDDIIGTAGRLAAEDATEGEGGTVIEALYVIEVPMSLPLDARVPDDKVAAARRALARAKEVGEEYEGVEVATVMVRGRTAGARIVEEARRRGVEAIVLAADAPTLARGGSLLGGRGGPREKLLGDTERYVLEKAPCRVVLTAPPASEARATGGSGS